MTSLRIEPAISWLLAASFLAAIVGCHTPSITKVTPEGSEAVTPLPSGVSPAPPSGGQDAIGEDLKALIADSVSHARRGFRFLPGDKIEISVFGYPELRMVVRLPRDLQVGFPHIGHVDFADKSIRDVEKEIRSRLEEGLVPEAQVSILPTEFAERTVFITGNVVRSGAFPVPPFGTLSLVQLISLAGGFSDDADRDRILLTREEPGSSPRTHSISYSSIERGGNMDLDVFLKPGDRVLVPSQQRVFVLGSVNRPGGFPIGAEGLTASKAVALAQGFTRLAAPNSTVVIRVGEDGRKTTFRVPLSTILGAGNDQLDLDLKPGDVVFVPESLF